VEQYRGVLDLASVTDVFERGLVGEDEAGGLLSEGLDGLARLGAQLMLQVAVEREMDEFLDRRHYEKLDGKPGYRNGHRGRTLTCGSGSFDVKLPKVKGAPGFVRRTIPAYQRSSDRILKTLPLLYAEGLSTRDFERSLGKFWQKTGLSRSSVSRCNKELYDQFEAWRKRDLSQTKALYLFFDGVMERVRFGSSEKEGVLVVHAILEDGSRELLAMHLGPRESETSWRAVLDDLVGRGLTPPKLAISDGCPGLIAALKSLEAWEGVPRQRCVAHKIRNVMDRLPRKEQSRVKKDIRKIFYAPTLDQAKAAVGRFLSTYGERFPTACETLCRDIDDCLTFYLFPEAHWKRIRTSNVIERAFKEVRRRTRVVGRFPNEKSALVLMWASMEQDRLKWRGVRMSPSILQGAVQAVEELKKTPIRIESAHKYLAVA
jgi:transposase-like protein